MKVGDLAVVRKKLGSHHCLPEGRGQRLVLPLSAIVQKGTGNGQKPEAEGSAARERDEQGCKVIVLRDLERSDVGPDGDGVEDSESKEEKEVKELEEREEKRREEKEAVIAKVVADYGSERVRVKLTRGYKDLTSTEVFAQLFPAGVTVPTSFETIGHIAHLNLLPCQLPYKHIIGQVLLDKNPALATVVNKTQNLSPAQEFRACPFELLAGEARYEALLVENGLQISVDYEKVYWNSRLLRERETVCQLVAPRSLVCDVMAGVGGFGLYCAKFRDCQVRSNDLNPAALPFIRRNATVNRVANRTRASTLDAGEFITQILDEFKGSPQKGTKGGVEERKEPCEGAEKLEVKGGLKEENPARVAPSQPSSTEASPVKKKRRVVKEKQPQLPAVELDSDCRIFFLMNLPAIAIDFLAAFRPLVEAGDTVSNAKDGSELEGERRPGAKADGEGGVAKIPKDWSELRKRAVVFVYGFSREEDYEGDLKTRIEAVLGPAKFYVIDSIRQVRDVSPKSRMYAITISFKS